MVSNITFWIAIIGFAISVYNFVKDILDHQIKLEVAGLADGWVEWVAIGAGLVLAIVGIVIIHKNKKKSD